MAVKVKTRYAPPRYSRAALEKLWVAAGGNPAKANIMSAIALAESGGNPRAESQVSDEGSKAQGLWQIETPMHSSVLPPSEAFDPLANAKAAVEISNNGTDLTPWETYTNGAYKRYLGGGESWLGTIEKGLLGGLEVVTGLQTGNPGRVATGAEHATGPAQRGGEEVAKAVLPKFLPLVVDGVLVLAGMALVVIGIMVAVRPKDRALSLPSVKVPPVVIPG